MATITTLRPSAVSSGVGWSAVPSGTLADVTSDDNDATHALWSGDGSALILGTPIDAPPAGERRHLVRVRARGEDGSAWWAVRLASGSLVAGASATFGASPETVVGSWQAGAPPDGSTILSCYATGQTNGVKIVELYLDVDSREAPDFTPLVLDGSGASTTTVADTNQPTLRASALQLDGLPARQYRFWVTQAGVTVWDTGVVSGAPVNRETAPLINGSYVANYQIWTTLGANIAYASAIEQVAFTVNVGAVPAPAAPVVTENFPLVLVQVCGAESSGFDDYVSWVEVERVDCPSTLLYGWDAPSATMLSLPGASGAYSSTADHASLDIVGDIDLRAKITPDDWTPGTDMAVLAKWNVTGDQRSYQLLLMTTGVLRMSWSTNGTLANVTNVNSTVSTGFANGSTHWVRATLAVATGTVTFYVGEDGSNWTQLGAPVVGVATSIFNSNATLKAGARSDGGTVDPFLGSMHQAQVLNGINGTVVANPRFDQQTAGAFSFVDSTGKTWAINGTAALVIDPTDPDGWVGEGSTHVERVTDPIHDGTGALEATETFGVGFDEVRFNDASGLRDLSLNGPTLGVWVLVPAGATGTGWQARLEVQDPAFVWVGGPNFSLTPGEWAFITYTPAPSLLASMRSIGLAIGATDVNATQAVVVDTLVQGHGDLMTPQTITSIAILGPLEEDECAEVLDYTIPRSGAGAEPCVEEESCCSYYRARTVAFVDGALLVSDWTDPPASLTCMTWDEDEHLIRTSGPEGPMWISVWGKFEWDVTRPFTASTGVNGTRFVTSAPPGGRNLHMVTAVESEDDLNALRVVLARPLVLISPSDASEVWAAPVAESVRVVKINRIRAVTADFIATGPQPPPQHADVGV
jgi:hypothetical protein